MGLKPELAPIIRNFYQEFDDTWYPQLKSSSLILKKIIATYCDKTIVQTNNIIKETFFKKSNRKKRILCY